MNIKGKISRLNYNVDLEPQFNLTRDNFDLDDDTATFIGRTLQNENDNSTGLIIPLELSKELYIENSKVLISILCDYEGNKYLLISKFHREVLIG